MLKTLYNLFGYNDTIFTYVNYMTNKSILPYFFLYLSKIFELFNFTPYYIVLVLYFVFKIKIQKPGKEYFLLVYRELFRFGMCYAFIGIIYSIIKFGLNMPRPYCSLDVSQYISIADISRARCLSSFPSAHISLAIMVYYFLLPYIKTRIVQFAVLIIVCLVGISRITLAMHFPSELIYSAFLALGVIYIVNKFSALLEKQAFFISIRRYVYDILSFNK